MFYLCREISFHCTTQNTSNMLLTTRTTLVLLGLARDDSTKPRPCFAFDRLTQSIKKVDSMKINLRTDVGTTFLFYNESIMIALLEPYHQELKPLPLFPTQGIYQHCSAISC